MLTEWNAPSVDVEPAHLAELFARAVAQSPMSIAVVSEHFSLTYAELDARTNRLARRLIALGVGPDSLVAVALPRSNDLIVALLAVVKAGGGYLPIDVMYPQDRLAFMLADAKPVCIISATAELAALDTGDLPTVLMDAAHYRLEVETQSPAAISDRDRVAPLRPDSLAYVIYTSGSTGRPKGVLVSHRNVVTLFANTAAQFSFGADDVWTMFHSYAFDFSVWELWGPLLHGGRLVVVDYYTARSPEAFRELLVREKVTVLNQTPTAFYQLAEADRAAGDADLALRYIVFGGEALDLGQLARWYDRHDDASPTLVNMYGITETTVHVSYLRLTKEFAAAAEASVIGRAIPGLRVSVLDQRLHPVPIGVKGEMYVSGAQLTRGYLGRQALCAGRFVADPSGAPGERMYRTGDVARWNSDGKLEYLGRSDFQVKIRGFRIELGEIESALLRCPGVAQSIAIVRKDGGNSDRIVGYVVAEEGVALESATVLEFAGRELTSYMVPSALVVLAALPLTENGKLDRKALPAPDFEVLVGSGRAPVSDPEQVLARLFVEVLGLDANTQVGVDDSFFGLGGDSIMSIQLVSRAKAAGLALTPRDVFERKTVGGLAEVAVATESDAAVVLAELPGGGTGDLPLTPIMEWLLARGANFTRHSQSAALQLPHGIDEAGLARTVQAVLDHHDMLRSSLEHGVDGWSMTVPPAGSVRAADLIAKVEVAAVDNAEFFETASVELDAAAGRLDPEHGVMVQLVWLQAPTGDSRLLIVVHHAVIDGVSWRVIVPELATAWSQIAAGAAPELSPVGTSMRRWAHGLVDAAAAPERIAELELWRAMVGGTDPLIGSRPLDPTVDVGATIAKVDVELDADVTAALLTAVPEVFHGSVNDGLLAALALALTKWRGNRDRTALVSLEGHGREDRVVPGADLGRTIGWFTTIHPLRLDLSTVDLEDAFAGGVAVGTAVKAVKEQLLSIPDNGIGYGLLRYLNAETARELEQLAVPQVSFNYLGRFAGTSDRTADWLPIDTSAAAGGFGDAENPDMPIATVLDINAVTRTTSDGPRLSASFSYPAGVLNAGQVGELARLWTRALTAVASYANSSEAGGFTPSDFPMVHVGQAGIERLEAAYPTLSDLWPLSPLQSGLLFHAILSDETVDSYMVQLSLELAGEVDPERMRRAGQSLLDRHPNLRTSFVSDSEGESIQVVHDRVELPYAVTDLSDRADSADAIDALVSADRATRFDMSTAPLLRMALIKTAADRYRFMLTNHHILLDGWSTPLLVRELLTLYATDGDATVLPRVRSYRDYLSWLTERSAQESVDAWAHALAGVEEPTVLVPADPGRQHDDVSREHLITIDETATSALREIVRGRGITMNTVVQTAWGIVLGTLTSRNDVVFGATVSGRPPQVPGIESMIGLFINTLPVRVTLRPAESLGALLDRVQSEQAALLDHHYVSLPQIQRVTGPGVGFDTLTVFESYPVDRAGLSEETDIAGMKVRDVYGTDSAHYPLTVVASADDRLHVKLKYQEALLDQVTVCEIGARLSRVLGAIVTDTEQPLAHVRLLSDTERAALAPVRGRDGGSVRTLPEILSDAAANSARALALSSSGRRMSYRDLDERSNRLARVLIEHGAGPETFVALGMSRSIESIVSVWAIAKTGAAFVPIDPRYPSDRIAHMLSDSGAALGLCVGESRDKLGDSVPWLLLDDPEFEAACAAKSGKTVTDADRIGRISLASAAYVIYTSGSTGLPKGVVVTHSGLDNFVGDLALRYEATSAARTLHFSTPSFDGSIFEYLLAFGSAATMVIAPPTIYGGAELAELIAAERVTHAFVATAALATMEPAELATLQTVVVGGEACPTELVARWAPGRTMTNGYGPTETTIMSNVSAPMVAGEPIMIGGPIRGTSAVVLDSALRPVPVGVPGELYIAGPGLARGYHQRSGLTAGRFVANPHSELGERMYRTGDVVRWVRSDDGFTVEYIGRSDFQVKVRGFRIELGEIDAALMAHPAVGFAVTLGRPGPAGDTVLVSYVRANSGYSIDSDGLAADLAAHLPSHMVPAVIVALDEIPLTPVGKLDRAALPEPEFGSSVSGYRAPRTTTEQIVAQVFAAVLGIERVGRTDSFFELGGNSLSATRVIGRINAALGVDLAVRTVFEGATVADLATAVDNAQGGSARPALRVVERPEQIPVSFAQQRMWFINQFDTQSPAYNIPLAIRLTGTLDVAALATAVRDVIERHESLRTRFPVVDGNPTQRILAAAQVVPELEPISIADPAALQAAIVDLASTGFNVAERVPVRAALYRLGPDEHVFALVVHHICADGFSMGPLAIDVMTAYTARTEGNEPGWAPLAVQYADYTLWQHETLGRTDDPESLASLQLEYWRAQLTGLPEVLELPADHQRPAQQTFAGDRVRFTIPADLHEKVVSLSRENNSTVFMTVHAVLAVLLGRLGSTDDVAVGTPISGRGDAALDDLVGMLVNTLVLRSRVSAGSSFTELLEHVRGVDLSAFGHADLPFERLVEVLNPARSGAYSPLFQVVLAFQSSELPRVELPGLTVEGVGFDAPVAKYDLQFNVSEEFTEAGSPAGFAAAIDFATDLFEPETIRGFADRFIRILDAVTTDPGVIVGDIDLLDAAEVSALAPARGEPSVAPATFPALLADAVAMGPDATALVYGEVELTYRELDERSNRLARVLIEAGIGPESFVALAMSRSIESVVAEWAVAKAGAAFLPVDPTYPADRIEHMLTDSGAALGITLGKHESTLPAIVPWLALDDADAEASVAAASPAAVTDADRTRSLAISHPAYLIYTSGSTGKPKGVIVTHRGLSNLLAEEHEHFDVVPESRVAHLASPSFDASLFELTIAFSAGAAVVIVPPNVFGGHPLADLLRAERVTHCFITPTALASVDDSELHDLQVLIVGGEAAPAELVARFAPGRRMYDGYGPTETTIQASVSAEMIPGEVVNIGRPARGFEDVVLDTRLRPVPVGVAGELYISGPGLARGYHRRSGLTSTRFIANPFGAPGELMYRTGDIVRWRKDGNLEYIGRSDFQVKVRGFRIELGEIDTALASHPAISFATTIGQTGPSGDAVLVAYVLPAPGTAVDVLELRSHVAGMLPSHMVPAAIVVLDEIPLTPVGKLDRRALPVPTFESKATELRLPTTPMEELVVDVFAAVLGIERVSTDDSFFDLGGNSLVATRVISELQTRVGREIPLQLLFLDPSPAGIARRITDLVESGPESVASSAIDEALSVIIPLRPTGSKAPLFCIHPGIGLSWGYAGLTQHLDSDRPVYGVQLPMIGGGADFESIEQLAAHYVDHIRRVQPEGPYNLMGWSLGGVIAQAMAVELRQRGADVDTLAVLDSYVETDGGPAPKLTVAELLRGLGVDVAEADGEPTYERAVELFNASLGQETGITPAHLERIRAGFTSSASIMADFTPSTFDGGMLFFSATAPEPSSGHSNGLTNGNGHKNGNTVTPAHSATEWLPYAAKGIHEFVVGCEHNQMIDPSSLAVIGPILEEYLAQPKKASSGGLKRPTRRPINH
nr:non-ribosomal peptide synthetase [Antrihabitans sp. YC2-6]